MTTAEQLLEYISPHFKYPGKQALLLAIQYTVELSSQRPLLALMFTKEIYPIVAKKMHCSTSSAENAIYRAITACWMDGNNQPLNLVIGRPLPIKPTPSEMLMYCAYYLINGKAYHTQRPP